MNQSLTDIINEAKETPGLEDRIPEGEAYAESIRQEQDLALGRARILAELGAAAVKGNVNQ